VVGLDSGSSKEIETVRACPFDYLACDSDTCFMVCPDCGLLKPVCSRFDVVKFNSKGFPRDEFGDVGKRVKVP
jgi:hypothetical protein